MFSITIMIYLVEKNWNQPVFFRSDSRQDHPAVFMIQTQGRSSRRSLTLGPGEINIKT